MKPKRAAIVVHVGDQKGKQGRMQEYSNDECVHKDQSKTHSSVWLQINLEKE